MGPDEMLRMIRLLVEKTTVKADQEAPSAVIAEHGIDLAGYVNAMDAWLEAGGSLPKAWDRT